MKNQFTFRLYGVSLETVQLVAVRITEITRHDADLGRQARRALTSIHLNVAESMDAVGGNRTLRLRTALGSTNEVIACLDLGSRSATSRTMSSRWTGSRRSARRGCCS